jgi:bidirectional [NiFe] hydrogenase diaphorase subunit
MHQMLTRLREGNSTAAELSRLEALCDMVKNTSLCGLGQSAPNPVMSTLRYFREEYTRRLRQPSGESAEGNGRQALPLV